MGSSVPRRKSWDILKWSGHDHFHENYVQIIIHINPDMKRYKSHTPDKYLLSKLRNEKKKRNFLLHCEAWPQREESIYVVETLFN
jgi:hypothetical protein